MGLPLPTSLRVRLPLVAATLVLITALLMATGLGWLTHRYLIEDVDAGANQAIASWRKSLPGLILQDNVWGVYEALTSVTGAPMTQRAAIAPSFAVVMGTGGRVFAASDPHRFPTASLPRWRVVLGVDLPRRPPPQRVVPSVHERPVKPRNVGHWRIYTTTLRTDTRQPVATLVYAVSDALYRERLRSVLWWFFGMTLLAVVVLLPCVWLLTRRQLSPLWRLRASMTLGSARGGEAAAVLTERQDEVGELARAFRTLLEQIEEAGQSEKLAAIGSLATATAHEINNPLGGMINAVSTARRFGRYDQTTRETLDLLHRGLEQLRVITLGLLAQTRPLERDLSQRDLADLAELIEPKLRQRRLQLTVCNGLPDSIPVATGPVRQATLNLLLNACAAASPNTTMRLDATLFAGDMWLRIEVINHGAEPPKHVMRSSMRSMPAGRHGFGLWHSRRLLSDIGGILSLYHAAGVTTARIEIPLRRRRRTE